MIVALEEVGAEGVADLCVDIDNHSADAGFSHTPRPSGGYRDSPLLDPSSSCRSALAYGYAQAMALAYRYQPSLEECIATIRALSALL